MSERQLRLNCWMPSTFPAIYIPCSAFFCILITSPIAPTRFVVDLCIVVGDFLAALDVIELASTGLSSLRHTYRTMDFWYSVSWLVFFYDSWLVSCDLSCPVFIPLLVFTLFKSNFAWFEFSLKEYFSPRLLCFDLIIKVFVSSDYEKSLC